MHQTVHIFRKDVRHLWPAISLVLLLVAAHAICDVLSSPIEGPDTSRVNQLSGVLAFLLVLSWLYLIAAAIYEERLPGDTQFWVTRPYSRTSLLSAKILFSFIFFCLPLFLSDCYILAAQHLPLLLPALAERQLTLTLLIVLPSFLVATLTRGIAQFFLGALAFLLVLIGELLLLSAVPASYGVGGLRVASVHRDASAPDLGICLLIALVSAAIVWQYVTRRSAIARCAVITYTLVLLPVSAKLSPRPDPAPYPAYVPGTQLGFDPSQVAISIASQPSPACQDSQLSMNGRSSLSLPVLVRGLPPGIALLGSGPHVALSSSAASIGWLARFGDQYCLDLPIPRSPLPSDKPQPLTVKGTLYLTAITDKPTLHVPASQSQIVLPDSSICQRHSETDAEYLLCRSGPYQPEGISLRIQEASFVSDSLEISSIHSPRQPNLGLSPVAKRIYRLDMLDRVLSHPKAALREPGSQLIFTPLRPLGYGKKQLSFHIDDLHALLAK